MTSEGSRAARSAFRTTTVRLVNYGLGFVASVFVARALGPEGRGDYAVIVTVATTATAVGQGAVAYTNLSLWRTERDRAKLVGTTLALGLGAGAVLAGGGWLVVSVIGPAVFPVSSDRLLMLALSVVPVGLTAAYATVLLLADARVGTVNKAEFIAAGLQTTALVGLAATDRLTVASVIVIWSATMAIPLMVQLPHLLGRPGVGPPSIRLMRRQLKSSARYAPGTIADHLLLRVDVLLLNAFVSLEAVGLYALAVTLAEATFLVTNSIGNVAIPGQLRSSDDPGAAGYTARVTRINVVVATSIVGMTVLAAPLVVPPVFGGEFEGSVVPLLLLAPGVIGLAFRRPLEVFSTRQGQPGLFSAILVVSLLVNLVANFALIPHFGIGGAAVASSIAYLTSGGAFAVWFWKATGVAPRCLCPRPSDLATIAVTGVDLVRRR